jgi:hypothetical protein
VRVGVDATLCTRGKCGFELRPTPTTIPLPQKSNWLEAELFKSVRYISMSVDEGSHAGESTLIGLAYSWLLGIAANLTNQIISPLKNPLPHQFACLEELKHKVVSRKIERWPAYKFLQAVSNMLKLLTNNGLCEFKLPDTFTLRRPGPDEVRVLKTDNQGCVAYLRNMKTKTTILQMPLSLNMSDVKLATLVVDKCSTGISSLHFAQHEHILIWWYGGNYHALARDIANTCKHSASGTYEKTRLFSTVIWKFNYGPFGSGSNYHMIKTVLSQFLEAENVNGRYFRKYCHRIWKTFASGPQHNVELTPEEQQRVWDSLNDLENFETKGSLPKNSRWGSWNESCQSRLPQFWILRMLLEWHFGTVIPSAQGAQKQLPNPCPSIDPGNPIPVSPTLRPHPSPHLS